MRENKLFLLSVSIKIIQIYYNLNISCFSSIRITIISKPSLTLSRKKIGELQIYVRERGLIFSLLCYNLRTKHFLKFRTSKKVKSSEHHKTLFSGFSKLNRKERLARLLTLGALTPGDIEFLNSSVDPAITELSENFVENVVGCFPLPLGVAVNFVIDNKPYIIPMAVEETSIIAAASNTAKWIRDVGEITTSKKGSHIIGQIQIAKIANFDIFNTILSQHKQSLINDANQTIVPNLITRGGGIHDLILRKIPREDEHSMAVIHVLLNPCDAMGANLVNQVCEHLKETIQTLTQEAVNMCIVSNLVDTKVTHAKVVIHDLPQELGHKIAEASLFAELDPYRAATSNKGVLNGIDPILIATGNDWRAVEAGIHAYASRHGQYQSITTWRMCGNKLIGEFEAPIIVGTVGGVTRLHPTAQLCLRILGVTQADELSRICAAVGLVQNLGAIKALVTSGIVEGHMKLHIQNLMLAANPTSAEQPLLEKIAKHFLQIHRKITVSDVTTLLTKLREGQIPYDTVVI